MVSILDYEPNVPDTVKIVPLTDEEYTALAIDNKSYFDIQSMKVVEYSQTHLSEIEAQQEKSELAAKNREFLNNTDWKVLRHIREAALGLSHTLSPEQYLELEQQRASAAAAIES